MLSLNDLKPSPGCKLLSSSLASHCGKVTRQSERLAVNFPRKKSYPVVLPAPAGPVCPCGSLGALIRDWGKICITFQPLSCKMPLQRSILPAQLAGKRDFPKNKGFSGACQGHGIQSPRGAGVGSHSPFPAPVHFPVGQGSVLSTYSEINF